MKYAYLIIPLHLTECTPPFNPNYCLYHQKNRKKNFFIINIYPNIVYNEPDNSTSSHAGLKTQRRAIDRELVLYLVGALEPTDNRVTIQNFSSSVHVYSVMMDDWRDVSVLMSYSRGKKRNAIDGEINSV